MLALMKGLIVGGASAAVVAAAPAATAVKPPRPAPAATLTVENDRPVPSTVYLEHGDFDTRLGTVAPDSIATLTLPADIVRHDAHVQVAVEPRGEFVLSTPTFAVRPGTNNGVIVPAGPEPAIPAPEPVIDPDPRSPATSVLVRNHRGVAVEVRVERGQFERRLGEVAAHQSATLRIPDAFTNRDGVQLLVFPTGEFDLASRAMFIRHGEHMDLLVPRTF